MDTNLPNEIEANVYARDAVAEVIVSSKPAEHKPVVYSLPKNTTLEPQHKLESIIDIEMLQVCPFFVCLMCKSKAEEPIHGVLKHCRLEKARACTYTHQHTHTPTYSYKHTHTHTHTQVKFCKDVTSLLGVPFELVSGGFSSGTSVKPYGPSPSRTRACLPPT
jgi:hypothetical protein